MKKRKKEPGLNYSAELNRLKQEGPARLYLLWGEEEYLRDSFLTAIRELCFPDGDEGFQHRVFKEAQPEPDAVRDAIDTAPFFSERTLVELRDPDFSKSSEELIPILSDIPDWCTVVFLLGQNTEPDGRLKFVKFLRQTGREIRFTVQDQNMLLRWIARRFAFYGKGLEMEAAQRLIYLSGDQMKALIPEIDKIAAYAKGEKVTAADVNAVANRIAEAGIFDLTDAIAERRFSEAAGLLADLLEQRDSSVPAILSMLSNQFRRLFLAKEVPDPNTLMELTGLKYDFMARRLISSARGFRIEQLRHAVSLCAEADYRLKSGASDEKQLLKETLMRIALEAADD
ncbi:MAG: DNA polymerase III subunit delta [Oscillospiraceae bacterium]|nr:DNA polymerase III subunit delta [Oscillospiraceae bacterium]